MNGVDYSKNKLEEMRRLKREVAELKEERDFLKKATAYFAKRQVKPGLILHSDRRVQYRAGEYQQALIDHKITPSMSRKGNCWECVACPWCNAVMESFFGRMKVELIYAENYKISAEVYSGLFEYIEVFYNRVRRHSSLGYKSPAQFEELYHAQCA